MKTSLLVISIIGMTPVMFTGLHYNSHITASQNWGGGIECGIIGCHAIVAYASMNPSHPMQPTFDGPRAAPFTVGLFFGALGIIGICTGLIFKYRKTNSNKIKYLLGFIALAVLLTFSLIYATYRPIQYT